MASSQTEVNNLIGGGEAKVGIVIPPNYGEDLTSGQASQALVLIDGSDPTVASAALSAAELAGQVHGVNIKTQQLSLQGASIGGNTNPVDVRTDVLYNPDLLGAYSIVPGLIALNSFSDCNQPDGARHRPGARAGNNGAINRHSHSFLGTDPSQDHAVHSGFFCRHPFDFGAGNSYIRRSHSRQYHSALCHDRPVLITHTWLWTGYFNGGTHPTTGPIDGHAFNAASHDAFRIYLPNRVLAFSPSVRWRTASHNLFHLHHPRSGYQRRWLKLDHPANYCVMYFCRRFAWISNVALP